jgi:hypothetical protein
MTKIESDTTAGVTMRMLLGMTDDVVNLVETADRVRVQFVALATANGVKLPESLLPTI